jgi:hypothetical protein
LVIGALAGVATRAASQPDPKSSEASPQCDLAVSQRTGGWFCFDLTSSPGPRR